MEDNYRLNIAIDVDASSFEDALEQGLDLLMQAPSMSVDVWNLRTKETKLMESSPDKAVEVYGNHENASAITRKQGLEAIRAMAEMLGIDQAGIDIADRCTAELEEMEVDNG